MTFIASVDILRKTFQLKLCQAQSTATSNEFLICATKTLKHMLNIKRPNNLIDP